MMNELFSSFRNHKHRGEEKNHLAGNFEKRRRNSENQQKLFELFFIAN